MGVTVAVSLVCTAIGVGVTWQFFSRRLMAMQQEVQELQQQATPQRRPEIRNLVQEILDVATRMDGDVGRHTNRLSEVSQGIQQSQAEQPSAIESLTGQLLDANLKLRGELQAARKELNSKQRELEVFVTEARTDTLTGLRNRRSFDEELGRNFAQRQRQGVTFSLVVIDIDHFKKFNDDYGHLSGDLVLRSVAQVLTATLREMDVVCRYGGEEFTVICPGSKLHEAVVGAERVRQAVAAKTVSLKEGNVTVTISLGVAEVQGTESPDDLTQRADEALYAAKHAGRNCVRLHNGRECQTAPAE